MKLPFPLRPLADRLLRLRNLQLQRLRQPWYTASSCRRYLERDPLIIFDVGANVGDVSIELAQGFPNAQVLAFEPVPHSFKVLQDRAQSYPNLVCHSQAVSASSGRVQMRVPDNSLLAAVVAREQLNADEPVGDIEVDSITIDEFCQQHGIEHIDLMKIDAEGHELAILAGAKNMLKNCSVLVLEFGLDDADQRHCHLSELTSVLSSTSFRLIDIHDMGVKEDGRFDYANAVFRSTN